MSEPFQPSARFHRVTTRRRNLRALQCPLEPELLVAEFAGELPPEVALAVREHIAVCETCGARSKALRTPYQTIALLSNEPVSRVPDLRDSVRVRLSHGRALRRVRRITASLGRGGMLSALSVVGALALIGVLIFGIFSASAENLGPSSNQFSNVPAAAAHGVVLAETDKLATVTAADGTQWQAAEVIAISEKTGAVLRSLPSSGGLLHPSHPNQLPTAMSMAPDGKTIYEVTAPNAAHQQALIAFDTNSGAIHFIAPLTLPGKAPLPAGEYGDALAIAPDGSLVYVGLALAQPESGAVRVLVFDAQTGVLSSTLAPGFQTTNIPEPPPPGSLPVSVFPKSIPHLNTTGMAASFGAGGNLVISPDGQWLFDEELLSQNGVFEYAVVRRFSTATGGTMQELAISGDFHISQLAVTNAQATQPQLYLFKSSPNAIVYILDPGNKGPAQTGLIALGGPAGPPNIIFSGAVSLGVADGTYLYATQTVMAENGAIGGHDLWLLDTQGMTIQAHLLDNDAADSVLANPENHYTAAPFLLRDGEVLLAPDSLNGTIVPWLSLSDGHPIIALLGVVQ